MFVPHRLRLLADDDERRPQARMRVVVGFIQRWSSGKLAETMNAAEGAWVAAVFPSDVVAIAAIADAAAGEAS